MNPTFFRGIERALAPERLNAYRQDGVGAAITMARYLWNMAICESLYSPLQIVEIALRNAIHGCMAVRQSSVHWYDTATELFPWQQEQVANARRKLREEGKTPTSGQMIAELHFGFWTSFFNRHHARTGIGHVLASQAFAHAPRSERNMSKLDARLNGIRELRNRVFHHERIIHWKDLDQQHGGIVELIGWISPELQELATVLDRYTVIRKDGLDPWMARLRHHWSEQESGNGEVNGRPD